MPVVTPGEMGAIDAAAPEPVEVLIGRAGGAVAHTAVRLLGGTYGRRVVVLTGKGNNGNDGREAARRLRRKGVRVHLVDAADLPEALPACDLVIDAAYGTGFRGEWAAPVVSAPVLAVDIPSGVDGLTGAVPGGALAASRTLTFAALKPGLLLAPGGALAGEVEVADIGLDVSGARIHLVEADDVAAWLPRRPDDGHKWQAAVRVVAGSPGMTGAAHLSSAAAFRAGAGYVTLSSPGVDDDPTAPTEVVGRPLPSARWDQAVIEEADRYGALAVGPGLGTGPDAAAAVRAVVANWPGALVVDGDGLTALGETVADVTASRSVPAVLTPHEGEFARLAGGPPDIDRIAAVRSLASTTGAVVLLKGPATVVAAPDGTVLITTTGDARLATAGTGDVLTGVIAALLAGGVDPLEAAAAGAFIHGRAGAVGWRHGLVASDLLDQLPIVIDPLQE
jgi:ADP-dependent NAD(P)H-hydrate dehydratase / NAD(P)H-hydrate epimerase